MSHDRVKKQTKKAISSAIRFDGDGDQQLLYLHSHIPPTKLRACVCVCVPTHDITSMFCLQDSFLTLVFMAEQNEHELTPTHISAHLESSQKKPPSPQAQNKQEP